MSLIDQIVTDSRARLAMRKRQLPLAGVKSLIKDAPETRSFFNAIYGEKCLVAEYKRKSPSKGNMMPDSIDRALGVYRDTPFIKAVSVLTDEAYFAGSLAHLKTAREVTQKPVLRKDFIYDTYQVYEARAHGADAILLMTQLFVNKKALLHELFELAKSMELDVLFEVGLDTGDPMQLINLLPEDAKIVGVNSRFFKKPGLGILNRISKLFGSISKSDLSTDRSIHIKLRELLPPGCISIAESGIHNGEQLAEVFSAGYQAALVGTAFMAGPGRIEDTINSFSAVFKS